MRSGELLLLGSGATWAGQRGEGECPGGGWFTDPLGRQLQMGRELASRLLALMREVKGRQDDWIWASGDAFGTCHFFLLSYTHTNYNTPALCDTRLTSPLLSFLHSEPAFEPATITHNGGAATQRDQTVRDSEVAVVPRDAVVRCIEARARAFQGWRGEQWVERLRTQRYRPGGHYNHHFDWSSSYGGWGRVSSFMVWVEGSPQDEASPLVGGGTEFPLLKRSGLDETWCRFIECDAEVVETDSSSSSESGDGGVVFRPLAGNAVYWENFRTDGTGRGWDETWHAGLPVKKGTKVGLNIWTWGRID